MELPSGNVTFLFADVEGSTRLHRRLGARYRPLLERYRRLLRSCWADHDGVEVKVEGDGSLAAFASSRAAVRAAVEGQRRLVAEPWQADGVFSVRMGLHRGQATPRAGGYIALAAHEVEMIASLAHGGQVVLSPTAAAEVAEGAEGPLVDLGLWRLRDFDAPIRVYQLCIAGMASEFPALRARPAESHNLRPSADEFVGRERDLVGVGEQLREAPLVSLVGPGGVGKTRAAVEFGHRNVDRWRDGVWFVDLTSATKTADVISAVGQPFGVDGALNELLERLAELNVLLILDNCEQVIDECAALCGELLSRCRDLAVLATSREPLGLAAERVWRLAPLVDSGEAAELFTRRARAVDPRVEFDAAAVADICANLDGLPIAIELAAARLGVMSLGEVRAALADRLGLLRSRRGDLDRRHRTCRRLLDWSYDLLDADEQVVFRRLSVFASSFDLDEAQAAVGDDRVDVPEAVWSLVDRSLVVPDSAYGETRYRFLLTVREYARDVARRQGDHDPAAVWTAQWYAGCWGPERCRLALEMSQLDVVVPTVRRLAAVAAPLDLATAQHLAWIALRWYTLRGGRASLGDLAELVGVVTQASDPAGPLSVDLLAELAVCHGRSGQLDLAQDSIDAADRLVAGGHQPRWGGGALEVARAGVLLRRGEFVRAAEIATTAAAAVADDYDRVRLLSRAGTATARTGDLAAAGDLYRECLDTSRAFGWVHYESVALGDLAENHFRLGDTAAAAQDLASALRLSHEMGYEHAIASAVLNTAHVSSRVGAWTEALQLDAIGQQLMTQTPFQQYDSDAQISTHVRAQARSRLGARAPALEANAATWTLEHTLSVAQDVLAAVANAPMSS